jgi:hypothetical protein
LKKAQFKLHPGQGAVPGTLQRNCLPFGGNWEKGEGTIALPICLDSLVKNIFSNQNEPGGCDHEDRRTGAELTACPGEIFPGHSGFKMGLSELSGLKGWQRDRVEERGRKQTVNLT